MEENAGGELKTLFPSSLVLLHGLTIREKPVSWQEIFKDSVKASPSLETSRGSKATTFRPLPEGICLPSKVMSPAMSSLSPSRDVGFHMKSGRRGQSSHLPPTEIPNIQRFLTWGLFSSNAQVTYATGHISLWELGTEDPTQGYCSC